MAQSNLCTSMEDFMRQAAASKKSDERSGHFRVMTDNTECEHRPASGSTPTKAPFGGRPSPPTLPLRTIAAGPAGRENSLRVSERCIRGRCRLPCTIDAFDARKGDGDESQTRIR